MKNASKKADVNLKVVYTIKQHLKQTQWCEGQRSELTELKQSCWNILVIMEKS